MQSQDSLPFIDEVTAGGKSDPSRLPSYRETRRYRYHPYGRPISVLVNEELEDRLLNTIFDDEHVVLNVPPLTARRVVMHPLLPQAIDEFEERLRQKVERVVAFELRVRRLSTVFVDFVAGVTRATRG